MAEKIFSEKAGEELKAGDFAFARIDKAMIHDITGPLAIEAFNRITDNEKVWDPSGVIMLFDHQVPADSIIVAENHIMLRKFAEEQGIVNYDVKEGICHQIMVEKGHVLPGDLIVGGDSHTCTYGALGAFATGMGSTDMGAALALGKLWFKVPETIRFEIGGKLGSHVYAKDLILKLIGITGADGATYCSCEFAGRVVEDMEISGRLTMCNMAIEMGGKTGIVEPDDKVERYLREIYPDFTLKDAVKSDEDAMFKDVVHFDASSLEPQVAVPPRVDDVHPVREIKNVKVDQVFLGSCTNGRYEDLKVAAEILRGDEVAKNIRMIVIPASRKEYLRALNDGLIQIFIEAGALVEFPCCGPCMGGSFGLIGKGEVSVSTSNRNFIGRQGSPEGEIYLVSPATAASTALYGELTDPRDA